MSVIGKKGEDLASRFLVRNGYTIRVRNFKTGLGEIDLIVEKNNTVVFIEVKTRTNTLFGYPFEAVDMKKRKRIKNAALLYLKKYPKQRSVRFDVLSILLDKNSEPLIEHIIDAFD